MLINMCGTYVYTRHQLIYQVVEGVHDAVRKGVVSFL